jgi:hypothetical protein
MMHLIDELRPHWSQHSSSTISTSASCQDSQPRRLKVLDLCSGTGCIGLTLAHHFPRGVDVLAIDLQPHAVRLGDENRHRMNRPSLSDSSRSHASPARQSSPPTAMKWWQGATQIDRRWDSSSNGEVSALSSVLPNWQHSSNRLISDQSSTVTFAQADIMSDVMLDIGSVDLV